MGTVLKCRECLSEFPASRGRRYCDDCRLEGRYDAVHDVPHHAADGFDGEEDFDEYTVPKWVMEKAARFYPPSWWYCD